MTNIEQGDVLIATQKHLLRQLYMPLHIRVEQTKSGETVLLTTLALVKRKVEKLLSRDLDGVDTWIDPGVPITETRIADVARELGVTNQEARSLCKEIAADFHLKFA